MRYIDPLERHERRLARRAGAVVERVDPQMVIYQGDGELFEGPVISVEYPDAATRAEDGTPAYSPEVLAALPPLELQEMRLQEVARQLTSTGLLVQ